MPAVAGSKGTAEPGKAERKEDGRRRGGRRERAAPAGTGAPRPRAAPPPAGPVPPRGHAAGGDRAAALPGMPIAASTGRSVQFTKRREDGKRERMKKYTYF